MANKITDELISAREQFRADAFRAGAEVMREVAAKENESYAAVARGIATMTSGHGAKVAKHQAKILDTAAKAIRANDRGAVFESELGRESVFSAELNTWVTITA